MIKNAIDKLEFLCNTVSEQLLNIDDKIFNAKISLEKWSNKEILGHLIDIATNNHQRFVRVQFEEKPSISYHQDNWNMYSFYQQLGKEQMIHFWAAYNKHLLSIIKHIPNDSLHHECVVGDHVYSHSIFS